MKPVTLVGFQIDVFARQLSEVSVGSSGPADFGSKKETK